MLKLAYADIFKLPIEQYVLAHGCNMQGVMGAGFAKELKKRFPTNYLAYRLYCVRQEAALGSHLSVLDHTQGSPQHIVNLIVQKYYGRNPDYCYLDYSALRKCLWWTVRYAQINKKPLLMPPIGLGLANGNIDKVVDIYRTMGDHDITVVTNNLALFNALKEAGKWQTKVFPSSEPKGTSRTLR